MLTWDEIRQTVNKAQSTSSEDFERHLADYMVQGVLQKLMDDYIDITMRRLQESGGYATLEQMEGLVEMVSHECAIFMTGIQVGWYMAEGAYRG